MALSDLAAMGAEPGEAYVQLGVPADRDEDELLELAGGLAASPPSTGSRRRRRRDRGAGAAGRGDRGGRGRACRGWSAAPARAPGDLVVVTGELGGAAAGLRPARAIRSSRRPSAEPVAEALRRRQLEPEPRLAAGRALAAARGDAR